ncbi:MAG: hypothetical protein U0625_13235 [Phycisphaerales bacterium]
MRPGPSASKTHAARRARVAAGTHAALLALGAAAAGLALLGAGCQRYPYDPTQATRAYPRALKQESVVDIQVISNLNQGALKLVNATANTYTDFDLWINQRYMRHIPELKAGETLELDIESFWDERGEGPFPGGWFRYYQPTPIVLAQIQVGPDKPLIGLISKPPDSDRR